MRQMEQHMHHGHVDHDAVALGHPRAMKNIRELRNSVMQLVVRDLLDGVGHGTIVDYGCLLG